MSRLSAGDLTYAALGIALIAVCSWISIPTPVAVPFTLQTFAICLVTALLGLRVGTWTVVGYILLGAAGVPVFSGFRGGLGALAGTTGGYILGFVLTALTVGLATRRFGKKLPALMISMALGILQCYAFGTAWFMVLYSANQGPVSLGTALGWCVIPYLLPDLVKLTLASLLTRRLDPVLFRRKA